MSGRVSSRPARLLVAIALLVGAALIASGVLALMGVPFVPVLTVGVVVALILAAVVSR